MIRIGPESLGSTRLLKEYGVKYAYLAGAMYKGIASKELVVALGKAGFLGYLGTGGMARSEVESAIRYIQSALDRGQGYGLNLLCNMERPELEDEVVDLCLQYGVRFVEAAAFIQLTPSVVRYRLHGIRQNERGEVVVPNRVLAKVSRPEVARVFMEPAPAAIVDQLVAQGHLTPAQAQLSRQVPMAHEICVEADSGGHTDQGVAYALMPAIFTLRDEVQRRFAYEKSILVGAAGGIGTPHAAAAAFAMGADFVLTGSINQCTVESGISDSAKDLLQTAGVNDTAYAPAGDMFELGAKVQVLKRGVFFLPGPTNCTSSTSGIGRWMTSTRKPVSSWKPSISSDRSRMSGRKRGPITCEAIPPRLPMSSRIPGRRCCSSFAGISFNPRAWPSRVSRISG
ncbi:PfaD family polyunsaturated fatty acid/polyketide biosynthesis protein [Tahibacter amnicola]|uniref:PfaD family polyunsaturated fatty acid/polyketide biosynthesis protein n=1 Tax=Tahibacter amnicola TaxID=2976241 RepID=A0ABY6B8D5_9GAMM|nr:PfaD family polyunsaturated fatty acid/polyketide biosynthesis protein [Tahibacter amnicola]UXI65934.1 PfaD family polyunsaturated fatty acid/polyketide biosynthesis protein [Tahibacter amnicola]